MSDNEGQSSQETIWDMALKDAVWGMALKGATRGLLAGMVLGAFATPLLLFFAFYVLRIGGYWLSSIIESFLGGVFFGTIFGAVYGAPVGIVIGVVMHFKSSGAQSESAE